MVQSQDLSTSQIRAIFPNNLKKLIGPSRTIKSVSDEIGIPRQQLNRYLLGQSIPSLENLSKLCDHFDVDARILLEDIDDFSDILSDSGQASFSKVFGMPMSYLDTKHVRIPNGIYRMWKPTFAYKDLANVSLVSIKEDHGFRRVTGLDPAALRPPAIGESMVPTSQRRFRGVVLRIQNSHAILSRMSNGNFIACTILQKDDGYRLPLGSYFGLCSATLPGETMAYDSIVPVVYEPVAPTTGAVLAAARRCGAIPMADLPDVVIQAFKAGLKPYSN